MRHVSVSSPRVIEERQRRSNPDVTGRVWIASLALAMTWTRAALRIGPCANCPSCTFSLALSGKSQRSFARLAATRGALRDRHGRWKRDAMDAACCETNSMIADGEIVWSWRPKAGATFREMTRGNGDNKAWSPGRSRISRNTIAQGRPGVPARTCGSAACFFSARGPWVRRAPGLPCALCFR